MVLRSHRCACSIIRNTIILVHDNARLILIKRHREVEVLSRALVCSRVELECDCSRPHSTDNLVTDALLRPLVFVQIVPEPTERDVGDSSSRQLDVTILRRAAGDANMPFIMSYTVLL